MKEMNFGNFIVDGMFVKVKEVVGVRIVIINGGGIRVGIDKGDIIFGEVLNVMLFGNMFYVVDLIGK